MLLWDIIRDWFVMNIFGGVSSSGLYSSPLVGRFGNPGSYDLVYADQVFVSSPILVNSSFDGLLDDTLTGYISLGDWLSTTSTIIVLIALCFFFFLMVRWLFRLTAGLIQGRG